MSRTVKQLNPPCLACGRPLRTYRWRVGVETFGERMEKRTIQPGEAICTNPDGTPRQFGDYGDNVFCGQRCGYLYATRLTRPTASTRVRP